MSVPPTPLSQPDASPINPEKARQILEVALLTAQEPLPISELGKLFNLELGTTILSELLEEIQVKWSNSGVELVIVASGWRFQSKPEMQLYLNRLTPQKVPRYSRAVLETLAIIAYRQPVTRGDIEEIRGVNVSNSILKTLATRRWIEIVGQRNVPGKPALFAITPHFLDDLKLRSLEELPTLEEMKSLIEASDKNQALAPEESEVQRPEP